MAAGVGVAERVGTPRVARVAVAGTFLVSGLVLASWVARIPEIQRRLELSEGGLGLALLGAAVGALVAMPLAGWLIARLGSRPVTTVSGLLYCASLVGLALAPSWLGLLLALMAFGACNGVMDVAMNAQAAAVERLYGRSIMSGFHGLWSTGGLVGAGAGGLVAQAGVAPLPHFGWAAVALALVALLASRFLLPAAVDGGGGPAFARPTGTLLGLGAIAFCVMIGEGAVADWSAIYIEGSLGTGPALAAGGFAMFSFAMAVGRLAGDRVAVRLGAGRTLRLGGLLAAAGLALALGVTAPWAALLGLGLAGLGLATGVPLAFGLAARTPGVPPGPAIAAVTTVGYTAFFVGPPVIGFLAEATSLRLALGIVVVLCLASALLAGSAERPG